MTFEAVRLENRAHVRRETRSGCERRGDGERECERAEWGYASAERGAGAAGGGGVMVTADQEETELVQTYRAGWS